MIEDDLVGSFVVEVGVRQAWPFLTFCDNRPTPSMERRLYMESDIQVTPRGTITPGDSLRMQWLALWVLDGLVVESMAVTDRFDLHLGFASGESLIVFGEQGADASQPPWWIGST